MRKPGSVAAIVVLALLAAMIGATPWLVRDLKLGWEFGGGYEIDFAAAPEAKRDVQPAAFVSAAAVLTDRAHAAGYSEPMVDVLSGDKIRMILPTTEPNGKALVALRDPDGLPFPLVETYSGRIGSAATHGERMATVEALGLGVILAAAIMLAFYRAAGAIVALVLVGWAGLLLLMFNLFAASLSFSGIAASLFALGLAVDSLVQAVEDLGAMGRDDRAAAGTGYGWMATRTMPRSHAVVLLYTLVLLGIGLGAPHGFAITTILALAASVLVSAAARWFLSPRSSEEHTSPAWRAPGFSGAGRRLDHAGWGRRIGVGATVFFAVGFVLIAARPLTYGPNFRPATVLDLELSQPPTQEDVLDLVGSVHAGPAAVTLGEDDDRRVSVHLGQAFDADAGNAVIDAVGRAYGDGLSYSMNVTDPALPLHFAKESVIVIGYATFAAFLFVLFWLGWPVAVASIATVMTSVAFLACCYVVFGMAIDENLTTALLTVIGFALASPVAVLDRIELDCRRRPAIFALRRPVNDGVIQMRRRSVVTALTILCGLAALYAVGPELFRRFALATGIGVAAAETAALFIAPLIWARLHSCRAAAGVSGGRRGSRRIHGF